MSESRVGAPAAFRGYRLQTLYIINKILEGNELCTYCPEKEEDLSILDGRKDIVEVVQIKAYASSDLQLSDFKINKKDSFFRRILKYKRTKNRPKIKITSFDSVGPELMGAFSEKDHFNQEKIRKKLIKAGYKVSEVNYFFDAVSIELVDEFALKERIFTKIKEISMACSTKTTFDILNAWLYHCSEFAQEINFGDLVEKIYSIGENSNAQMQYKHHWGKTVTALKRDENTLSENDFTEGTFTNFNHIEQNLDIRREKWLRQMYEAHSKNHLVIMHGASGQGKTTLAYRYMKEHFAENFRFEITSKGLSSVDVILEIAQAIKSFASRIAELPIGIYIDIPPRDLKWLDILRKLNKVSNIFILVTIREEDWQRSAGEVYELSWEEIELSFSKEEAERYYQEYIFKLSQKEHLNFEEAWKGFGEKGPLLEFAYYLNQGMRLKEKLTIQIRKLEEECSHTQNYEKLELLKVITISSVYNSRVDLQRIIKCLNLKDITSIKYLENEYFIKIDEEENLLEGLHYVRSLIIQEIVIDGVFNPWIKYAKYSLTSIVEEDYEVFLKNTFYDKKDINSILDFISCKETFSPISWVGINGIIISLLWLGIRDYIEENRQLIDKVAKDFDYTSISLFILDFDIANLLKEPSYFMLKHFLDSSAFSKIQSYRKQQTSKKNVFKYLKKWIVNTSYKANNPKTEKEWLALGSASIWIAKAECEGLLKSIIKKINLNEILELDYKIEVIANVIAGINNIIPDKIRMFCEQNNENFLNKYRLEYNILKVEQTTKSIKIYKLVELNSEEPIGVIITNELYILRSLFPYKEFYSSQGIGHNFVVEELGVNFDETCKNISIDNLPLKEYKRINSIAMALIRNEYRPRNWNEFINWYDRDQEIIMAHTISIKELLINYFKKNSYKGFSTCIKEYKENLTSLPKTKRLLLPTTVIDKFGTIDESIVLEQIDNEINEVKNENLLMPIIEKYKKLAKCWDEFRTTIEKLAEDIELNILYNYVTKKKNNQKFNIETLREIESSKVDNWLILIKIRESIERLYTFSDEYHKLFNQWFEEELESKLEPQQILIDELQIILNYYAGIIEKQNSSYYNLGSAHKRDIGLFLNTLTREVKEGFEQKQLNFVEVKQSKLEENMLIIKFDMKKDVYTIFEIVNEIVSKISKAINNINPRTNLFLDIEKIINKVVIIPSYKTNYFKSFNWIIPFYAFQQGIESINPIYLIPQTFDEQFKQALKIKDEINTNLFEHYREIVVIMQHLNIIINFITGVDEIAQEVIKKYLIREEYEEKLSNSFNNLLDKIKKISGFLHNKTEFNADLELMLYEGLHYIADYLSERFEDNLTINNESIENVKGMSQELTLINLIEVELKV